MNFGQAITSGFQNYVVFEGRSRRSAYWFWILFTGLISFAISGFSGGDTGSFFSILASLWSLATLLPSLAVGVRRLHDTNRSGWFLLLALIPIFGAITLIIFFAQDGTPGENRFGANPKGA